MCIFEYDEEETMRQLGQQRHLSRSMTGKQYMKLMSGRK